MKEVEKCPADCAFDWQDFHKKLDVAFAHFIDEQDGDTKSTMWDFIVYSNSKKKLGSDGNNPPKLN